MNLPEITYITGRWRSTSTSSPALPTPKVLRGGARGLSSTETNFWRPGMGITAIRADERVRDVSFGEDSFIVDLMDGRSIKTPLAWFPRLLHAAAEERLNWHVSAAGYGIHWPDVDEDISTEGLLRGAPAPRSSIPLAEG